MFVMTENKSSGVGIPLLWRGGKNSKEFLTGWFSTAFPSPDRNGYPAVAKGKAVARGV